MYHTATHLLHKALRIVLGEHVAQKGSNITTERLRFDFSHPQKVTPEEIKKVEEIVNEQIQKDLKVSVEEMTVEEAKKSGAIGLFENKYGDIVKVYTIGDFSKEICGGPHVKHTGQLGKFKIIKEDTSKVPIDFYGRSKLEADEAIQKLSDEKFKTIIIRAPMVYGPNCKGNFPKLKKIAKILPIFPDIENNRSMIYIDNLVECIKQNIDNENSGVIYPQNKEYVSTKSIIEAMAKAMNKKMHFVKIFNPILKLLSKKINYINKIFGNKVYDKSLSGDFSYCVVDFETSIMECMK